MIIKTGKMKTTVFVTMVLFFLVTGCKKQDHAELTAQEWQLKEMSGNEKALTVELHRPYIDEITCTCPKYGFVWFCWL